MAVEADVVAIVNKAFVLIGDNKIANLSDGGEQQDIAEIYDIRLEELLGMGRWRFATKQAELTRNVTNPLSKWEAAYDLPDGDPDEVIMAIYGVSVDGENIPFDRYEDQIYCNASLQDAVILDYQFRPAEALFPARFKSALIDLLASDFVMPKSGAMSDRLYQRGVKKAKEALSMNAQERTARKLPVHAFTKSRRFWAPGSTYPATGGASGAGGGNLLSDGVYGDITILNGVWSFTDNSVDLAAIMSATAGDILYWDGSGDPALLNIGTNGQVLTISGGTLVWSTPGGGSGISDGDYGDITVSGSGTVLSIDAGVVTATELASNAVETAKINDDAVTVAKIAAGTAGDILYWNGSGDPAVLPIGTAGQFLKVNSGLPSWQTGSGGSLSAFAQFRHQTSSAVTSGTFTSGSWQTRTLNKESWNQITNCYLLYKLAYDGGSGGAPATGETVTGGTSGATATVWRVTGTGTSGTMWIYGIATGPFQDNEAITSSGTMNALVNQTTAESSALGVDYGDAFVLLDAGTYEIDAICSAHNVDQHKAKLYNITDAADEIIGTGEYADTDNTTTSTSASKVRGQFAIAASKEFELQHRCATTQASNGFGYNAAFSIDNVYCDVILRQVA